MNLSFKKIAKSITGVSLPVFGISWNPPESDREIVRKLLLYLEDKRALYYPFDMEQPNHVIDSVFNIREHLSEVLQTIDESSDIISHFRIMRASCRKFLDYFNGTKKRYNYPESLTKLGELRGVFGTQIAELSIKYGVDVSKELAAILPIDVNDE